MILCEMDDGMAEAALEGFTRQMKKMPAFMRKSLAYDLVIPHNFLNEINMTRENRP